MNAASQMKKWKLRSGVNWQRVLKQKGHKTKAGSTTQLWLTVDRYYCYKQPTAVKTPQCAIHEVNRFSTISPTCNSITKYCQCISSSSSSSSSLAQQSLLSQGLLQKLLPAVPIPCSIPPISLPQLPGIFHHIIFPS